MSCHAFCVDISAERETLRCQKISAYSCSCICRSLALPFLSFDSLPSSAFSRLLPCRVACYIIVLAFCPFRRDDSYTDPLDASEPSLELRPHHRPDNEVHGCLCNYAWPICWNLFCKGKFFKEKSLCISFVFRNCFKVHNNDTSYLSPLLSDLSDQISAVCSSISL